MYNFQRVIFQTEGFLKQTEAMLTEIDDIQSIILADKDIENKIDSIFKKKILKSEIPCTILDNTEKMQYSDIS